MHDNNDEQAAEEQRIAILDAIGVSLASKRSAAIAARASSGIEDEWRGDDEFCQGYDDANRNEFVNTASKPSANGGTSEVPTKHTGSTVFPNITQPYVDAAAARVGDMLLPTDDRNFALKATPIPDMFEGLEKSATKIRTPDGGVMDVNEALAVFEKIKADATRKAEKAETRIDDWLAEAQYHAEMRKVIDDCAKLGSGVMKGPVPVNRKSTQWQKGDDGVHAIIIKEEIKPSSFRVDPWNIFPDPACGESIHNGSFIWERDYLTEKKLEELKGLPNYINFQIDKCIAEGAKEAEDSGRGGLSSQVKKDQFVIWYYHGVISKDELVAAGCDCSKETRNSIPAMITMVNDRVIRASMNPLDSGEFPYDIIPWKRRTGMPWGMGVARQIRTPQRIVVAATRNMMDNAGLAAGPQIVIRRGIEPENGIWEIKPRKMWVEGEEADGQSGAPFLAVVIPMLQAELMAIIQLGMKLAEDVTGLPMLMQGQQGSAPETVGGMQILNNNANSVLRRVARLFDSCITEPHIRRYYTWLMEYSDDNDEKGDFQIIARGSSALVERDIQSQEIVNVIQMSLNPAFGLDPKRSIKEYLKSRRFDTAAFEYTEEEMKQIQENQQPAPMPQVEVAKIRADVEMKKLAAELQKDSEENALDRDLEQRLAEIDAQLASAKLSSEEKRDLERQKVLLASVTLKLQTQKDLSLSSHVADLHKFHSPQVIAPAAEPVQRAPNGQAFTQ